jgi:hypothetical protein
MTDEFFEHLIGALERAGIPYMVTGSFASSAHGRPRATDDLDIVIAPTAEQLRQFVQEFPTDRFYADEDDAIDALKHRSQFSIIDFNTSWKADLIVQKDREFSRVELGRRRRYTIAGVSVDVATAEDVLLAKLEFAKIGESARQIEDAAGIIRRQGVDLDRAYVERWVRDLGLDEQWRKARSLAG